MSTKINLAVDQGTEYEVAFSVFDANNNSVNLSSYVCSSQFRKYYSSISYNTFTINVESNIITLNLTGQQTQNLDSGKYVYDVVLTDNVTNSVYRIVEGDLILTPQVTR